MKESRVEKNADAEVLEWDIRVTDTLLDREYEHHSVAQYLRIKIFTDKGKDERGTVKIEYQNKESVGDVSGRTIRPDGSVIEMSGDAIFDKVVAKAGGLKVKERSFALPAVVPGAIIEYRWTSSHDESLARYLPLPLQLNIPVDRVTYHLKPVQDPVIFPYRMHSLPFNCKMSEFKAEPNGYYTTTAENIPAFKPEPQMPPEDFLRQWILIYYEEDDRTADNYWTSVGRKFYQDYKKQMRVNGEVKQIAETATAGAKTDDEKLDKLLIYCRQNLKDINGEEITTEERNKLKANLTTADTLRTGKGTAEDIQLAFAALATAAGFDARPAYLPDRSEFFFNKLIQTFYFMRTHDIAVQVNDNWKFYDVANRNLPPGVLRWQEQAVDALIADPKKPAFEQTPLTSAADSRSAHIGTMTLSADGTMEGDVRVILYGNRAIAWRERFGPAADAEREENLKENLKHRFGDFELSAVSFHAGDDVAKPIGYRYHIKVNNYAQRTGKRLFLTPGFFEAGAGARFPESERQYPIYFEYPWSETESVDIQLPAGYELDHADAPRSINFAPAGSYKILMSISKGNVLHYQRDFAFGENGMILVDAGKYSILKHIFDAVHEGDQHMLTLKAKATAGGTN
ncbi:MAG TPA: DUF3857 domain-containing protein [Bryobacteraceae bacterium]|jgi:transglutaminase-like putative cysteine protease|nr:DUF3857 domain-containing protein [Bryobacteraceae bacterium]